MLLATILAGLGTICALPSSGEACPKCKVATGDLAGSENLTADPISLPTEIATTQDSDAIAPIRREPRRFSFAAGADLTTAYFYRGYLQQDRGVIFQPYLTLSMNLGDPTSGGWVVQPYVGWWNSIHSEAVDGVRGGHGRHNHTARTETRTERYLDKPHPGMPFPHFHNRTVTVFIPGNDGSGKGWYETEVIAGATFIRGDFWMDLSYHAHWFPEDTHDFVHEVGVKISYDVTGFWDERPGWQRDFSLRPWISVFRELGDDNGDENTYMEVGLEPTWKFRCFGRRVAVSTPIALGGSPDGYYFDPKTDDDELLGYTSAALKASISLPVPEKYGHWYLSGSVTWLHLLAESAIENNRGDENEFIGTIGIGVSF